MSIDIKTWNSPGWWLKQCYDKLQDRKDLLADVYSRYEGDAPLPDSLRGAPETAIRFFRTSRTNFAEMIVKSVLYRLKIRYLMTERDSGETGDSAAWLAWRRAGMVQASQDAIRNALVGGDGYFIASKRKGRPFVTAEDPRNTVTIHDPVYQAEIVALGKFFHDPLVPADYAFLHRPGRVYVATYPRRAASPKGMPIAFGSGWEWSAEHGGAAGLPLPDDFSDEMLCFRLRNDEGVGEITRHRDVLDRIDHLVLQGMVVATLQAFKQRAIQVSEYDMPQQDPDTGLDINYDDVFKADPAALWILPETAKLWESGAVDITPISTMVTKEMEKASAVTFTALSVFTPEGANQSAQGASLVREGQTFKVEDRQTRFGDVFAQVAAAIFRLSDDADLQAVADPETIHIGWGPAERYGLTERTVAAAKAKEAGVPWRTIMTDIMGYSPEVVERQASERMDDLLLTPGLSLFGEPDSVTADAEG